MTKTGPSYMTETERLAKNEFLKTWDEKMTMEEEGGYITVQPFIIWNLFGK